MSDLVTFRIPAAFVLARVLPTPGELVYGFRRGWLTADDMVQISLAAFEAGLPIPKPEEELALLLSSDFGQVPSIVEQLERLSSPEPDPAAMWLFLILAWIYEHRSSFADPLDTVEMVYADFGYPAEIDELVRFMPAPIGVPTGAGAIEERWRAYLFRKADQYRERQIH